MDEINQIKCPVHLLYGAKDKIYYPLEDGLDIMTAIGPKKCTLTTFPNAAHYLHMEHPKKTADYVYKFIDDCE